MHSIIALVNGTQPGWGKGFKLIAKGFRGSSAEGWRPAFPSASDESEMSSDKAKKMKAAAKEGIEQLKFDDPDAIDGQVILSIEKLQEIQDELDKVNEEASDKVLEVEQKYNEIRMPVYARRNDIIKTIPDFWLTAFLSHPVLGELLSKEDQMIFKHLESLEVADFKDVKSGYSITLNFSSNPFFEDEKLSKTYSFSDEGTTTITGTTIKWKEGMDVTNSSPQKKGNKRTLTEESFFSWFSETQQKDISDAFYDEVAEIIKEDLWPNPLKYFNNDTDEESDGNEGDEEGNEDGGSDENIDDQEENGDEEDDG